jgi:hypothetical protein
MSAQVTTVVARAYTSPTLVLLWNAAHAKGKTGKGKESAKATAKTRQGFDEVRDLLKPHLCYTVTVNAYEPEVRHSRD